MFYAEQYPTELDNNNQDMFISRSIAASYLYDLPERQDENQLSNLARDSSLLSLLTDLNNPRQQQRTKRIYWENLAFHATDFNNPKIKKF